jgi:hypothetical protein
MLTAAEDTTRTAAAQGGANEDRVLEEISTDMIRYLQLATVIHKCNVIFAARKTLNIANNVFRLTARQLQIIFKDAVICLHADKMIGKTNEKIKEAQAKFAAVSNAVHSPWTAPPFTSKTSKPT